MKYRKKPVTVEAFRYDGDLMYSNGQWYCPDWAREAFQTGVIYYDSPGCGEPPTELYIDTLEGKHHVSVGDYIIQGVAGELYPCKHDIFEQTYEVEKEAQEQCNAAVERIGWIPVSERMPEDEKEVLVWFEYFQYGYYNRLYQTYGIGYAENGEWSPIVNGTTGWTDLNIIAWMPLPEPYKENWSRKRTGD